MTSDPAAMTPEERVRAVWWLLWDQSTKLARRNRWLDSEAAEDVFGAMLTGAWRAAQKWDPARGVQWTTYAVKCGLNEAYQHLRVQRRGGFVGGPKDGADRRPGHLSTGDDDRPQCRWDHVPDHRPPATDALDAADEYAAAVAALDAAAGPRERQAVRLVVLGGLTLDEAARVLRCTRECVRQRVLRGCEQAGVWANQNGGAA